MLDFSGVARWNERRENDFFLLLLGSAALLAGWADVQERSRIVGARTGTVKRHLTPVAVCLVIAACSRISGDESISREQLRFLETQQRPLFVRDVTDRLGAVEGSSQGLFYPYKVRGENTTVEFWMLPAARITPPGGTPMQIAMVIERRADAQPVIIWPRALRGRDIEAAKRRYYPKGLMVQP